MSDEAQRDIERGRQGKSRSGRLRARHEEQPPHFQVLCSVDGNKERLPTLASDSAGQMVDYLWMDHPENPNKTPVFVYTSQDEAQPAYVITPLVDGSTEVTATDGSVSITATPNSGIFRTVWTIDKQDETAAFTITERKRDAFWRRTFSPPTKLRTTALDWLGLVIYLLFLPALVKPPVRMVIENFAGETVGMITFAACVLRPREDFCLYLVDRPYPIYDNTLALAATAIMQRMR